MRLVLPRTAGSGSVSAGAATLIGPQIAVEPAGWMLGLLGGSAAVISALLGQSVLMALSLLLPLAALMALTSLRWAALVMLVVAALIDHFNAPLFGIALRPEWVVGVPLLLGAVAFLVRSGRPLRWTRGELALAGVLLVSAVSSVLLAPHRGNSLRVWLGLAVAASAFYLVRLLVGRQVDKLLLLFIGFGVVVCLFGVVSYLLYPLGFPVGVALNPDTRAPSAYATLWEADILGSFSGCLLIILVGQLLSTPRSRFRWWSLALPLIALLALEVSLARMAWIGTVAGLAVVLAGWWFLRHRGMGPVEGGPFRVAALAGTGLLLSIAFWSLAGFTLAHQPTAKPKIESATGPKIGRVDSSAVPGATREPIPLTFDPKAKQEPFLRRMLSLTNPSKLVNDPTVHQRIIQAGLALTDWRHSPILGRGSGSFGQLYTDTTGHSAWLSNIFIRVLHDSGIVGLALFVIFVVALFLRLLRAIRGAPPDVARRAAILLPAVVVLWAAAQATEPFQVMWPWILLGLVMAAVAPPLEAPARTAS
ncbi:MAG: hypothetical protein E6I88_10670 [Chloroflexi bacterium]|nr:MAG: hypothetical protein E6I88_10670 [Chloroflexota bacterium]